MRIPSRDLTDVTLVSEDHDGPDDHDDMMKMKMNMKMKLKEVMTYDVSPVPMF